MGYLIFRQLVRADQTSYSRLSKGTLRADIPQTPQVMHPSNDRKCSYQALRIATIYTTDQYSHSYLSAWNMFPLNRKIQRYTYIHTYPLKHTWIDGYMFHLAWHSLSKSKESSRNIHCIFSSLNWLFSSCLFFTFVMKTTQDLCLAGKTEV